MEHYTLISEKEVPVGQSSLRFEFMKTGEHRGIAALYINGEKTGEKEIPRTIPVRYGAEGFEIGKDSSTPVAESYTCPFAFTGILNKVVVELDGNPHQDPEGDFMTEMAQE
jgi:arylsulfatase